MDLTIPIIFAIGYTAYSLSEKESRSSEQLRTKKSENSKSVGDNIYSSKDTKLNRIKLQEKADKRYDKSKNTQLTNIVPNLFNTSCQVDCKGEIIPQRTVQTVLPSVTENQTIDKASQILSGPMFRTSDIGGIQQNSNTTIFTDTKENFSNFSSLAGGNVPVNSHNNMQPFFGGSVKQSNKDIDTVGMFTGNSPLYQSKTEASSFFVPEKQNIYGAQFNPDLSSYVQSNLKTDLLPAAQIKETYILADNLRPTYKTIDELEVNPKQSYSGRIVEGQKGSERGLFESFNKNRPETIVENSPTRYIVEGQSKAAIRENFINGKENLSESALGLNPGSDPSMIKQTTRLTKDLEDIFSSLTQTSTLNSDKSFGFRNSQASNYQTDFLKKDSIKIRDQERDTTNQSYISMPKNTSLGLKKQDIECPRTTIKDTNLYSHIGNSQTENKKPINYSAEETRESCKIEIENYISAPNGNIRQQSREQFDNTMFSTTKEVLSDLQNYMSGKLEGDKVRTTSDNLNVKMRHDDNRENKYQGANFNRIVQVIPEFAVLGENTKGINEYKQFDRLSMDAKTLPENKYVQDILK